MKVVVLHSVNGTTKTAEFEGPLVTWTPLGQCLNVEVAEFVGGKRVTVGEASIRDWYVALRNDAVDQYGPLSKPEEIK